jgi:hypothetical protein
MTTLVRIDLSITSMTSDFTVLQKALKKAPVKPSGSGALSLAVLSIVALVFGDVPLFVRNFLFFPLTFC